MSKKLQDISQWFLQKNIFLALLVSQNVLFLIWTVLIPAGEKNSFFLGYSIQRWAIFSVFFILIIGISLWFIPLVNTNISSSKLINKIAPKVITLRSIILTFGIVYLMVFLPEERFLEFAAYFVRLRPLLISFSLTFLEVIFCSYWQKNQPMLHGQLRNNLKNNRKLLWTIVIVSGIQISIYLIFALINLSPLEKGGMHTSNPILTPLQLFLTIWATYLFLGNSKKGNPEKNSSNINKIIVFILIWILSFIALQTTPFTCQEDLAGPFPPNDQCYPQINDSPLSIGSYYITLGNGVLNQWFTDKPAYMIFLAIGQLIYGPGIDNGLRLQIILLSLLPAIAFIFGSKNSNPFSGLMFSILLLMLEINNLRFFGIGEVVNVKVPATEILTSLFLLLGTWILSDSLKKKNPIPLVGMSGAVFALASLTRLNPLFSIPFVLIILLIKYRKNKKFRAFTIGAFTLGFLLVMIPAQLSLTNENGVPHSLIKIRNVFMSRYYYDVPSSTIEYRDDLKPIPQASLEISGQQYSDSDIWLTGFDDNPVTSPIRKQRIIYAFIRPVLLSAENYYRSFTVFPINTGLLSPKDIYTQPLFNISNELPIWLTPSTLVNKLMLACSLLLVTTGIIATKSHKGIEGLLPLGVLIGYFVGSGLALTSGGRFLQPVLWVMLFYISVGLVEVPKLLFAQNEICAKTLTKNRTRSENELNFTLHKGEYAVSFFVILLISAIIPATHFIQQKTPRFNENTIQNYVLNHFPYSEKIHRNELISFLDNPNVIIVEGFAYDPKIYDSPLTDNDDEVFEFATLTDDMVYISNLLYPKNISYFQDGSKVVIVGCTSSPKDLWGVQTEIVKTLAIFQLNHQKQTYVNEWYNMECK